MFKFMKKNIAKHFGGKQTRVQPSDSEKNQIFYRPVDYMDMLEQFWTSKPNNYQGLIVYETTFVQGGYTSFVTLPTGHCFANPQRCRNALNSRQFAARVALIHSMFGGHIFHEQNGNNSSNVNQKGNNMNNKFSGHDESFDSTLEEIIQNQSVSNIKCDKEESFEAMSYVLSSSRSNSSGAERFHMLLKLHLMHWNGSFRKLKSMRYTKQQIARDLTHLPVEQLTEFMTLEWSMREQKQPGVICLELARCQRQLFKATKDQQNVRVAKEKCLILISALDLVQ